MIKITSFNVNNLNFRTDKKINDIAKLVSDSDIVVLQEVLNSNVIEGLSSSKKLTSFTNRLGNHWEGKWVNPQTRAKDYPYLGDEKRNEGYAYLWNTQKVELLRDEEGNEILPKRFSNYHVGEGQIRLKRDPGYGRFLVRNKKVEIRVITTHIIYGKPKDENISVELDTGAINMRRDEFYLLSGKIYKYINDHRKDININAVYTIIIGDYNLNLYGRYINATIPPVCCFDSAGNLCSVGINTMKTVQDELTTINKDGTGFASNYDHCTYNVELENKKVIRRCYRKLPVNEYDAQERIRAYRDTISDHLPIVIELNC